jgi:hypothetical protein
MRSSCEEAKGRCASVETKPEELGRNAVDGEESSALMI